MSLKFATRAMSRLWNTVDASRLCVAPEALALLEDRFYGIYTPERHTAIDAADALVDKLEDAEDNKPVSFELTDDGTLDTVVRCTACGREERFNFDCAECSEDDARDCTHYDAWVQECCDRAAEDHVCGEK